MSQLTAEELDVLADPLKLLVLITKQNGELGEERVHHSGGSAPLLQPSRPLSLSAKVVANLLV